MGQEPVLGLDTVWYTVEMVKTCTKCKQLKALTDFAVRNEPKSKIKRTSRCLACMRARPPAAKRKDHLLNRYGIPSHEVDAKAAAQSYKCRICNEPAKLCVDHNHTTGKVRDLLCRRCNFGLGAFRERPALMLRAADYIMLHAEDR